MTGTRAVASITVPRPAAGPGVTLVGIPTRNEADTVGAVARAADAGLTRAFPDGTNMIVLADNGSTDGTVDRFLDAPVRADTAVLLSPGVATGKGTNVLAIVDKALALGARRLVLLDGDLRSADPRWVGALAAAVEDPAPTMALPVYRRNRYEANSTNHLVRPLLAAAFGSALTQPIGGDFAFNRAFLERLAGWSRPASAQLYGIDVWLTANALREGDRIVEVPLGRKVHNSPFPKILHLPQQVLDTLFHVIAGMGRPRPMTPAPADARPAVDSRASRQDPAVVARIVEAVSGYHRVHRADMARLFPSMGELAPAPWGLRVTAGAWPWLLAEALTGLARGEFERARDHLIALMVGRVMTYWSEIEGLADAAIDELLDEQALATAAAVLDRGLTFDRPPVPAAFHPGRWLPFQGTLAAA
jgi:hypothetical protein